jgi:4-azaleucine resistance transporter AzlC
MFARPPVSAERRRFVLEAIGFTLSAAGFGVIYGLAAREAGFELGDALAMSTLVLAGASQFAAVGLVDQGAPWIAIVLLTAFLNARHLLYSASLAPWLAGRSLLHRAAAAHMLTDETYALAVSHAQRVGRLDAAIYWLGASLICVPWVLATLVGVLGGAAIPDPRRLGLDVVFPAAMAGITVALVTGRRELVAAAAGVAVAVIVGVIWQPSVGVVAGGVFGPVAGLLVPAKVD